MRTMGLIDALNRKGNSMAVGIENQGRATKIVRRLSTLIEESKSESRYRPPEIVHTEIAEKFSELAAMETDLSARARLHGLSRKHASIAARIRAGMRL